MSGFGFGGFDLTSGFGALSDIGDKLQKLKDDVESSIDASLRADRFTTSGQEDQGTSQVDPSAADPNSLVGGVESWLGGGFDVLKSFVTLEEENPDDTSHKQEQTTSNNGNDAISPLENTVPSNHSTASLESSPPPPPPAILLASASLEDASTSASKDITTANFPRTDIERSPLETSKQSTAVQPSTKIKKGSSIKKKGSLGAMKLSAGIKEQNSSDVAVQEKDNLPQQGLTPDIAIPSHEKKAAMDHTQEKKAVSAIEKDDGDDDDETVAAAEERPLPPSSATTTNTTTTKDTAAAAAGGGIDDDDDDDAGITTAAGIDDDDATTLRKTIQSLQETITARESQIERQSEESSRLQTAIELLTKKNEELVLSKAKVSEQDLADMQQEFENRLSIANKKIQTLMKERDALKKESTKINDLERAVKEKEDEVVAIMAEGEALSKKQLVQETTIRQLRAKVTELEDEMEDLQERLTREKESAATAASQRASTAEELSQSLERHQAELMAERQQHERLLNEAKAATMAAERKAEKAVKAGAARKLKEAEAKMEALNTNIESLREELDRQRVAGDEREDALSAEISDLQKKCAETEARLQEAQNASSEAAALPLLRQLEAMQSASEVQSLAVAEAEKAFQVKLAAAEEQTNSAMASVESANAALEEATLRCATLERKLQEATSEVQRLEAQATRMSAANAESESTIELLRGELSSVRESLSTLERFYGQQMDALQAREAEAQVALAALQQELAEHRSAVVQNGTIGGQETSLQSIHDSHETDSARTEGAETRAQHHFSTSTSKNEDTSASNAAYDEGHDGALAPLSVRGNVLWTLSPQHTPATQSNRSDTMTMPLPYLPRASSSEGQLASLQYALKDLEATRDRLLDELVTAEKVAGQGRIAQMKAESLEQELKELKAKYGAATELLGEREEKIDELKADIEDMRESCRMQVALMAEEVGMLQKRLEKVVDG